MANNSLSPILYLHVPRNLDAFNSHKITSRNLINNPDPNVG